MKLAAQVAPQLIPVGALVTVPEPVLDTVSVWGVLAAPVVKVCAAVVNVPSEVDATAHASSRAVEGLNPVIEAVTG